MEEIFRKPLDFSNFNGLGEFLPFSRLDGRSITRNKNEISDEIEILLTEEFHIIEMVFNRNNNLLLYTYGGGFSIPAIYDVVNNQKTILRDILKDGTDEFVFEIVKNLAWKDDETILYTVIDRNTGIRNVKTYNIRTKHIEYHFSGQDINLHDYNPITRQMLFRESIGGGRAEFRIYDFDTRTRYAVLRPDYSSGYILSRDRILGFISMSRSSTGKSSFIIYEGNNVLMEIEGMDNVRGSYIYDPYANIFVLHIEENRSRYVTVVRLVIE